jgi:hypothetical protein
MTDELARALVQQATRDSRQLVAQQLRSLERANAVRCSRARLRRDVSKGRRSAADVILDPPAEALTATIGALLTWQRGWGSVRAERFLAALRAEELARVSVGRALQNVTPRERSVIAERLREELGDRLAQRGTREDADG